MPENNDRVARLMSEAQPRGLLETVSAEALVLEILEAGLRASPRLADRLEAHYRAEDARVQADAIEDQKSIIRSHSGKLGQPEPAGLDSMDEARLDATYRELRGQWIERQEREQPILEVASEREAGRCKLVEEKHGPLVRIECSYSIVTPRAFVDEAKETWLDNVASSDDAFVHVVPAPTASIEEIDEMILEEHIKPLLMGEAK